MKMHQYEIGYGTWEESEYYRLQHLFYFDQEELTDMIAEGIIKTLRKEKYYLNMFEHYLKDIIDYLIEEHEFELVKPDVIWSVNGWASLFSEDTKNNSAIGRIRQRVREAGYTKWDDPDFDPWTKDVMFELANEIWEKWL
jgi:hypothetical protein